MHIYLLSMKNSKINIFCMHQKIIVDADFVNSALFIFVRAKRSRAEDVECRIRNNIADAYETSY